MVGLVVVGGIVGQLHVMAVVVVVVVVVDVVVVLISSILLQSHVGITLSGHAHSGGQSGFSQSHTTTVGSSDVSSGPSPDGKSADISVFKVGRTVISSGSSVSPD